MRYAWFGAAFEGSRLDAEQEFRTDEQALERTFDPASKLPFARPPWDIAIRGLMSIGHWAAGTHGARRAEKEFGRRTLFLGSCGRAADEDPAPPARESPDPSVSMVRRFSNT